jgi:signal transduction histidine kinase
VFRWLFLSTAAVAVATGVVVHGMTALSHPRAWMIALVLGVLFIASSAIAGRLARPLEEVATFADALRLGDLSARLPTPQRGDHDLRIVQGALNQMADRLQQRLEDQRALLAAVSHELRSPLQRMRILVGLLGKGDLAPVEKLEREIGDMDQLVGDLLAGSRLDLASLQRTTVDATELALRALESAEEPPEKLNAEASGVTFSADPTLALRVVLNLVDNARRHGRGLHELRISRQDDRVRFAALDQGPGFAPDEIERLFLPFQQTSTSTSVGLGLSLVRRIAEAHGGRAFAENRPEGGAMVAAEFPA